MRGRFRAIGGLVTLHFPSPEFDDAVAAVCHGTANDAEMQALNELLRHSPHARDEYLISIELHSRLASEPDLFSHAAEESGGAAAALIDLDEHRAALGPTRESFSLRPWLAMAACLVLTAVLVWSFWFKPRSNRSGTTSSAVAMLTQAVDARWGQRTGLLRVGGALEPGVLRLESGMAQVVFYNGARVVLEGPAEIRLVSPSEAECISGRLLADVPPPARGFRVKTDQLNVVDLGTAFGIEAARGHTEVHVFKGTVELERGAAAKQLLREGQAVMASNGAAVKVIAASTAAFAPMFEFQQRSLASQAFRYEQWHLASAKLNQDPSLLVHLDFEDSNRTDYTLRNIAERNHAVSDAAIVGCQRGEGRWREKRALEFQSVNDRVRLTVPGEFHAFTLSMWVCVKGLDRQFNSLFMCDGFKPGTLHWLIRNDGVLGLTVIGPGEGNYQIVASPSVLRLDRLGLWMHLAVVLDGRQKRVTHYVNGLPVKDKTLRIAPPFHIGAAELGNWNASGFPDNDPSLIRNFSGAMDEFCLFSRALAAEEIRALYSSGKPQPDPVAAVK